MLHGIGTNVVVVVEDEDDVVDDVGVLLMSAEKAVGEGTVVGL